MNAGDVVGPDGMIVDPTRPGRESLSQRAYNHVGSRLIGGAMRPGEKLILRPLAARLGLSPTPVREALLRLVFEQALVLDERGSAVVPVMTAEQIREMCEMRADLETRAAERAARMVRVADLEALRPICDASVASGDRAGHQEILATATRFRRAICRIGCSPMIRHVLEGLWIRFGPPYALASMHVAARSQAALSRPGRHPHALLMTALQAGDAAAAREAALRDVENGQRMISAGPEAVACRAEPSADGRKPPV